MERDDTSSGGVGGGSFDTGQEDHGGLDQRFDQIDREHVDEVGSDPPGGLGTNLGGGEMDQTDDDRASSGPATA